MFNPRSDCQKEPKRGSNQEQLLTIVSSGEQSDRAGAAILTRASDWASNAQRLLAVASHGQQMAYPRAANLPKQRDRGYNWLGLLAVVSQDGQVCRYDSVYQRIFARGCK